MNDVSGMLNTYMLMNFRSETPSLRTILQMCILSFVITQITMIVQYIREVISKRINNWWTYPHKGMQIFESKRKTFQDDNTIRVEALYLYILKTNKLKQIKQLEYIGNTIPYNIYKLYEPSQTCVSLSMLERYDVDHMISFPFEQEVLIHDDIYMYLTIFDTHKEEEDSNEKKLVVKHNEYRLTVYSKTHYVDYIESFVNSISKDYIIAVRENQKSQIFNMIVNEIRDNEYIDKVRLPFTTTKTFDTLFFEQKEKLIKRLHHFKTNKTEYKRIGMHYCLGILLHGLPGTGKSSCIKAMAKYLNRDLYIVSAGTIKSNKDFRNLFSFSKVEESIYVFEEVDCWYKNPKDNPWLDRKLKEKKTEVEEVKTTNEKESLMDAIKLMSASKNNETCIGDIFVKEDRLTLSGILEILDGTIEYDGRICIFTTNYPDRLDSALLRPGRIDINIEFKKLRKCDINDLYSLWFHESIPETIYNEMVDYRFSQAEIGNLFSEYYDDIDMLHQKLVNVEVCDEVCEEISDNECIQNKCESGGDTLD